MFDPHFRLSPDASGTLATSDELSSSGPWEQMSLDRLLEHHDLTPAEQISMNDGSANEFWSAPAQFNDFFNNYHRQNQQQQQQQNQPVDIASLLSASPPHTDHHHQQQQKQQQQQQPSQHFPSPFVDNHIFEPQPDPQPLFFNQLLSDNKPTPVRRDSVHQLHRQQQQQQHGYPNRSRQPSNVQQHNQSHQQRNAPVLQIPSDDPYHQQQSQARPRYKPNSTPAYIACLNHGINYNGVSGPPILLPPSF